MQPIAPKSPHIDPMLLLVGMQVDFWLQRCAILITFACLLGSVLFVQCLSAPCSGTMVCSVWACSLTKRLGAEAAKLQLRMGCFQRGEAWCREPQWTASGVCVRVCVCWAAALHGYRGVLHKRSDSWNLLTCDGWAFLSSVPFEASVTALNVLNSEICITFFLVAYCFC